MRYPYRDRGLYVQSILLLHAVLCTTLGLTLLFLIFTLGLQFTSLLFLGETFFHIRWDVPCSLEDIACFLRDPVTFQLSLLSLLFEGIALSYILG